MTLARRCAAAAFALCALSPARAAEERADVPLIDPRALRAHMRFLADDLLQGRATGSDGYRTAARYVAAQFEAAGLEPAGTDGYLQPVKLRSAELDESRSWLRVSVPGHSTSEMRNLQQTLILPSFVRANDELQGPLVFVGYGITAPDQRHDDYARIEVAGKVVAVLSGGPESFPDVLRAHHGGPRQKLENAVAHGAQGVIVLATPREKSQVPWRHYVRAARMPSLRWMHGDDVAAGFPELRGVAMVAENVSDRILSGAGRTPEQVYARAARGEIDSFSTGTRVLLRTVTRHRQIESPNVAAVLRGADPRLRAETVVYSAHLDHLGTGEPQDGDGIYNGAVDNASGVAAVIEIARALAARPQPPRRSMLFLAVTGEEAGLLGSDYFATHPPAAAGEMVADINLDGLGLLLPSADVVGVGADSSTLGDVLQRAAAQLGVVVSPDPVPAQALFVRSDQYSFVRQGIPSVFLNSGFKPLQPGQDLADTFQRWLGSVYHTPRDDMSQPLDLGAGARLARLNLLVGLLAADQTERPRWREGDFFGNTYGAHARRGAS
jgi:Zn-dependent M28 family amino/carboxypeptidase